VQEYISHNIKKQKQHRATHLFPIVLLLKTNGHPGESSQHQKIKMVISSTGFFGLVTVDEIHYWKDSVFYCKPHINQVQMCGTGPYFLNIIIFRCSDVQLDRCLA